MIGGSTTGLKLHPWNEGFTWTEHAGPFRRLTSAQARQFDDEGYVLVTDAIDEATLAAVRAECDRYDERTEAYLRGQADGRVMIAEAGAITFSTHLVARSGVLRAFAADTVFAELGHDLVGPDVRLYWDQAVYKKPEKPRRFPWHQDNGYTFVEPQQYLTCWVPLTDATIDNGCPHVVPGLHRLGTLHHEYVDPLGYECLSDPPGEVAVEAPAGSVVVFSSLTPHLTGPNVTTAVRKAYILQYAPDGARAMRGDPTTGRPERSEPCDEPQRQFPVLVNGDLAGPTAGERHEPANLTTAATSRRRGRRA